MVAYRAAIGGGELQNGTVRTFEGGGGPRLATAQPKSRKDWARLVRKDEEKQ